MAARRDADRFRGNVWRSRSFIRMDPHSVETRATAMDQVPLLPLIALIAGVLILAVPRLLNYIVAVYLIVIGVLGLLPFV